MTEASVTCPACSLEREFDTLEPARACIERHREETGHDPVWELAPLAEGVERAGAAAGVCGVPSPPEDEPAPDDSD